MWTHREIVDDVFTLEDLFDVHEALDIKAENERRVRAYCEKQRSPNG
jgi:hypothetical protein